MPCKLTEQSEVESLIAREHWGLNKSIRRIEREQGLSKTSLNSACKRFKIAVRDRASQIGITNREPEVVAKRSGENHWAWGVARPDSAEQMTLNNPSRRQSVRRRMSASMADTWKGKLTPAEQYLLALFGGAAVSQHAVGAYVLDLAFLDAKVAVEVDGKGHWSAARRAHDLKRDAWLVGEGWTVVRFAQTNLHNPRHLVDVLKELIPNLQVGGLPPEHAVNGRVYKHRVVVRDAKTPTGRKA